MTPKEIQHIKSRSPELQQALASHREVYAFLRTSVQVREPGTCEQCGKQCEYALKSPYNAPEPGWCVVCVLEAFFSDAPLYRTPEEIEEDRRWNAVWENVNGVAWMPSEGVEWA